MPFQWRIYSSGYYDDTKISGNSYDDITLQKDKKTIEVSILIPAEMQKN